METHASVNPFKTHGNAFNGDISIFNSEIPVNTLAAFNVWPIKTYVVNVRTDIITGVVAQKNTHNASKYLRPFKHFNSLSLSSSTNKIK